MKKLIKIICICSVSILTISFKINAQQTNVTTSTKVDSSLIYYSLFSEYYKNKDYESALPYGWKILEKYPEKVPAK